MHGMSWRRADGRRAGGAGHSRTAARLCEFAIRRLAHRRAAGSGARLHGRNHAAHERRRRERRCCVPGCADSAAKRETAHRTSAQAAARLRQHEWKLTVKRALLAGAGAIVIAAVAFMAVVDTIERDEPPSANASRSTEEQIALGRYLALAGNCAGCHTARGGAPYAGGRAVETPFGNVYASNLTSDPATG